MSFDTRTTEYPKPPQSEALVRRILSVAEILTRVQHEQDEENDLEKRVMQKCGIVIGKIAHLNVEE